jgi:hypothetical protein
VFTENTVKLFNNLVSDIDKHISKYLNKIQEVELNRAGLLDFGDFFEIQYDKDAEGQVYPDVYDEFDKQKDDSKKKKLGGKMPISPPETKTPPTEK